MGENITVKMHLDLLMDQGLIWHMEKPDIPERNNPSRRTFLAASAATAVAAPVVAHATAAGAAVTAAAAPGHRCYVRRPDDGAAADVHATGSDQYPSANVDHA